MRKHVLFQRIMYNRLLFHCPQLLIDVIFAAVSNQCPQRPPVWETLPAPQVAAEGLIETRKEAFLKELRTAKGFQDLQERGRKIRFYSPTGEFIP